MHFVCPVIGRIYFSGLTPLIENFSGLTPLVEIFSGLIPLIDFFFRSHTTNRNSSLFNHLKFKKKLI